MKKFCSAMLLLFLLLITTSAYAVPANSMKVYTLKQPDGTTFKATQHGDEYSHWIRTVNGGHIVAYNTATKTWYFAKVSDGVASPTSVVYRDGATPPANAATKVTPRRTSYRLTGSAATTKAAAAAKRWTPSSTPLAGTKNMLVIRVTFEDTRNNNEILSVDIDDHKKNIWTGKYSVKQYYKDQSKGNLRIEPASSDNTVININLTSTDLDVINSGDHPDRLIDLHAKNW